MVVVKLVTYIYQRKLKLYQTNMNLERKKETYNIDGLPVNELAKKFGTPCFVYSESCIVENFKDIHDIFSSDKKKVYYSVKALINNGRVYSTDVCLPISNITECVNYAEEQAKKFGLRAPMVGHLGDGNFHVLLPFDPEKKETYKKIREFNDLLIKKALELNGTITGEHGVGLHKKEYLLEEHGDNIPVMKMIKRSIDQNNIMNPGKIFDLN